MILLNENLYVELWVSLASLLRSYTAAHGLNGNRQATVELGEDRITVRTGEKWLNLVREGAQVTWQREDERSGVLEMTEAGRLRPCSPTLSTQNVDRMGHPESSVVEEEMDIVAEAWARELMQ